MMMIGSGEEDRRCPGNSADVWLAEREMIVIESVEREAEFTVRS